MRLLLALFLVVTTVSAAPNIDAVFHHLPNYYPELKNEESFQARSKRAIFGVIGISNLCEDGWTGDGCKNPICNDPRPVPTSGVTSTIELLFLQGSCDGAYYIPVDSSANEATQTIQIQVSAPGIPYVNLTDARGTLFQPSASTNSDGFSLSIFQDLPSGGYSLTVDNQGSPTTECIIDVTSGSDLKVFEGFVHSPQSDYTPHGESAIDGIPMYVVAHVESQKAPAQVHSITIRQGNSLTPIYRAAVTRRYQCAYEYYAGQWQCQEGNSYFFHIDGIDSNGFAFRRTERFTCMKHITPPPPSTTTLAPLTQCFNNGSLLNVVNEGPTCFCGELFTGRQCDKVNCMNAGFPDPDGNECVCASGYEGTNCQDVNCLVNWESFLTDYKTLIVIIRSVSTMNQNLNAIYQAINRELTSNSANGYEVYKGFVLVKFGNGVYTNTYYPVYDQQKFLSDINTTASASGKCSDDTFDSIASIFTEVAVYQKSPIYFFTDAIASDVEKWQTVIEMNTRQKFPIYTHFFVQDGCGFDDMSQGFQAIEYASYYSGGLILRPTTDTLLQIFQNVMKATAYKMNSVLIDDLSNCATPTRVFFVDTSTTELMILAVGQQLTVSVTDPNGATNTALLIVNSGTTQLYEIANPIVGEHLITVVSNVANTPCSYRVQARSEYDLFIGTSSGVNDDASDSEPVFGQSTHVVAQLTGLKGKVADPFRLFSEISITSNTDTQYQKPMYYSSGKYRDGCGFHLYFGAAAFCDYISQPFYATVYADDGKGFPIQRTTTGFCSGTPTTPYPPNTCQNGGVTDPTNNASCICPPGFYGTYCEKILCVNGGTARGGRCDCPVGTAGTFCEQYMCTTLNTNPDVSFDSQSLAFVISTRSTMKQSVANIASNVQTMTRDMQQASDKWITKWILIAVNSNTSFLLVNSNRPDDFVAGVNNLSINFSNYAADETSCQVQLEQAMLGAALLSERRSSVWVFSDSDGPNDLNYIQLFDVAQNYQLSLNLVGVGSSICTAPENNGQFPYYLKGLASTTLGDVYMTDKVDQILLFIVSLYKSAVSHRYFIPDCTQSTSYYMPVDGMTQSLTLAVTGTNLLNLEVTFPDGTLGQFSDYELVSINDPEIKLNQYIAACEGVFWNYRLQNCYEFHDSQYSWLDTWSECHGQKAYLLHIDNQDLNNYIHSQVGGYGVWIGLAFNNGQWYWDVPDSNYPQPLTGYTNWAPGVDPSNPAYNHVIMNANGQWEPANSSQLNYAACMKHRYGQGYYPGESVNIVPAGLWKVTVQSNSGSCEIQARSQSDIQVFFGFVTDPRSDTPNVFANIQSSNNYLIAYPTGVAPYTPDTSPSMEGKLNYAVLYTNTTMNIANSLPLVNRVCTYATISSPFSCPVTDGSITDFSIKFTGLDQFGYAFERYGDSLCTKAVINCNNGGFVNNGVCVCRAGWTGTTCSTPVCQNGGIERNGVCDCSSIPQYTGQFCQLAHCEPPYPTSFNDKERTLVLVLETSYNMAATIYQMKRNLASSLGSIINDPTLQGWFSNFVLYPFDSTTNQDSWYPVTVSRSSDDIVNAVNNIPIMTCPGSAPCSSQCRRPIVSVLKNVLNLTALASPNSVILFITRSSPEDYLQVGQIAQTLQDKKAYINFVFPAIESPCGEGWNTPSVDSFYQIISYSQGNTFTVNPVELSTNFISQYIPTLYSSGGIAASSGNCMNDEVIFQVEHEMYEFSIDFYHPLMANIKVFDPSGDQLTIPDSVIASDTNYVGIFPVNESGATRAGTYRVVVSGTGGNNCLVTVRGRSNLELFLGFVDSESDRNNGATNDAAHHAPINLENNTVVVNAAGLGEGIVRYVQIVMPGFGLMHTTEMKRRDSQCSYQWYAATPFFFEFDSYYIIIYGSSEFGSNWKRNFYVSTVNTRPPLPPPPASCDLNAVKQDTIFIIDSSLKESNVTFTILKQFAVTVQQPFNYVNGLAQVAALSVADKAYQGFSFNSGETSFDRVSSLLYGMPYIGTEGQNITDGLQLVLDYYDQPSQGYRSDADVRHLLVYVTQTNPTDADPSELLRSIKRSGLYEVVVVALDMTPSEKLTNMVSSRCFYLAQDFNALMNYGVNFVQGQSCLHYDFCNY